MGDLEKGQELWLESVCVTNTRQQLVSIASIDVILDKSGVVVPGKFEIEISHHYGLERFRDYGYNDRACE